MTRSPAKVRFVRAGYFVWLIVPTLMVGAYHLFGTPYIIWSYDWRPLGPTSYADFDQRHYTRCTFLGWGPRLHTEHPANGRCGWVRFVKRAEAGR